MKPLIAITPRLKSYTDSADDVYVKDEYLKAVAEAGGIPCVVYYNDIEEIANTFDGLIVTGGADVNPEYYHAECSPLTYAGKKEMDKGDIALIKAFDRLNKPILGICRGIQIINVAFGGTLIQDIPSTYNVEHNQMNVGKNRPDYCHNITVKPNTHLKAVMKDETIVNSFHHQSVDQVAEGFIISAQSGPIIEAIEKDNILAVQWHPEMIIHNEASKNIFKDFVFHCSKR